MPMRTMSKSCAANNPALSLGVSVSAALSVMVLTAGASLLAPSSALDRFGPPEAIARVEDARIREASGIVASRKHAGHFYVNNDSGDTARVFLINRAGKTATVINLRGVQAVDCEDIALAPGSAAGDFDVCLADIGDNKAHRDSVRIYRFPEPALPTTQGSTNGLAAESPAEPRLFTLRYVDGPRNAEAFFVDPHTGDGYILTKREDGASEVYRLAAPWNEREVNVLKRINVLRFPGHPASGMVTAADISADGEHVAIRTYAGGWELSLPPAPRAAPVVGESRPRFQDIFNERPQPITLAAEGQGEALCYTTDGQALLTIAEGNRPDLYEARTQKQ